MEKKTTTETMPESCHDDFHQAAYLLKEASSWALFTHQKIDGDALGSATALFEAGRLMGKQVRWCGPDPLPPAYFFLPHTSSYLCSAECSFDDPEELYIFLDSANEDRSVRGLRARAPGIKVLNLDHHEDNTRFGTWNCVDASSSSTAEVVLNVMKAGGWEITPLMAECLYVGIISDTGGFVFTNTTSRTHRHAAELLDLGVCLARLDAFLRQTRTVEGMRLWGLAFERIQTWGDRGDFALSWLSQDDFNLSGAVRSDTEGLIGQLMLIGSVRFVAILYENEGAPDGVKASFRSKEGCVDAALVARSLGGGGHPRAAGASLSLPLPLAIETVRETVERLYAEWAASH